ncbi:MAG: anti-sigma factor [Rhodospirillaceae bacterium]|nr:MAG: anti-sigma factor [Rhodospirillaceae bacterium]
MSIRFHPRNEILLAYATGTLEEAASVLIATHLALCPQCRTAVGCMEAVGGALLDALPAAALDDRNLTQMMTRLDEPASVPAPAKAADDLSSTRSPGTSAMLPQPLRGYVAGDNAAHLPWHRLMNLDYIDLKTRGRGRARLLRVSPGGTIPYHGHSGEEFVLVLAGGYSDGTGAYHRGDVASADPSLRHAPVAEPGEACICMTVNYGVLLPTRILAPLARLFRGRVH